jgi:hypothetical protein
VQETKGTALSTGRDSLRSQHSEHAEGYVKADSFSKISFYLFFVYLF